MGPRLKKILLLAPAFVFGAASVALLADAATGPIVSETPPPVAAAAPAPESLAVTTTTRDWNETAGSVVRRR